MELTEPTFPYGASNSEVVHSLSFACILKAPRKDIWVRVRRHHDSIKTELIPPYPPGASVFYHGEEFFAMNKTLPFAVVPTVNEPLRSLDDSYFAGQSILSSYLIEHSEEAKLVYLTLPGP